MAACQIITHRAAPTVAVLHITQQASANVFSFDPFIPLASEFLMLLERPEEDGNGDCSRLWNDHISTLEAEMAETPPQTMAGLQLGLKVIHANGGLEWTDLEANIIAAGIRILETGDAA